MVRLVDHLVEQLVGRQDLVERLLERDAVQLHGVRAVLVVAVVGDVDAGRVRDEVQDVADAGVGEPDLRQHLIELDERRRTRLPRLLAELRDVVGRPRLGLVADAPLDLGDLRRKLPVRRIELAGAAVLAQRLFELAARLGELRLVQMLVRRVDHRALERNLVVGPVGRLLDRLAVVLDGGVPVAGARRVLAAPERPRGTAPRGGQRPAAIERRSDWSIECTRIIVLRVESSGGPVRPRRRDRPIPRRFSEGGSGHR